MWPTTDDLRIQSLKALIPPALLMQEIPASQEALATITMARKQAQDIIQQRDDRLLVIVGPCSIHDINAAKEYGSKLKPYLEKFQDSLLIFMRVYFEKPRTIRGWKGLINDPHLDESFDINTGLKQARHLLAFLSEQGIPCATEFLDIIIPQFISDFISWGAIGARTTESQIHRELASGLSMPVGFKNGTDGNIQIAIDAIRAARYPHHFLSVTKSGLAAIVSTRGNEDCHVILRGSTHGTNFDEQSITDVCEQLRKAELPTSLMVDCSHGNSCKDPRNQAKVIDDLCSQLMSGSNKINGIMLESHLHEGRQEIQSAEQMTYGQSVTDACIGFEETIACLAKLADAVQQRRNTL